VEGREDLPPLDRMSEIRSERDEGLEDCVANFFLPIVPGPGPQPVRRVLRVHRQRGFARRRQTGIRYRMEDAVQERFPRGLAPFRVVPGLLQVLDGRTDVDISAMMRLDRLPRPAREVRELREDAVHFRDDPGRLDPTDAGKEVRIHAIRFVVAVASIAFTSVDSKNSSSRSAALERRTRRARSSASAPRNRAIRSDSAGGASRTIASMSSMTSVQNATYFG